MNKEQIKKFLKPDKYKLSLFIIFGLVNAVTIYAGINVAQYQPPGGGTDHYGIPFIFYFDESCDPYKVVYQPELCPDKPILNTTMLALNLVSWYLISCAIVLVYEKVKSKRK